MRNKKTIAIHQPSFFPWLGFFNKIIQSDTFVILDNVQYPKTGGYWANRVRIIINGKASWITMPVIRSYTGFRRISEMEIDNTKRWREKLERTILMSYGKAHYFKELFPLLQDLIGYSTDILLDFNLNTIQNLCKILGINFENHVLASTLEPSGKSTNLIVSIVEALGGTEYLSGTGAKKYIDEKILENTGIKLTYQNFAHPAYSQLNTEFFVSGLSIIDSLMNCGKEKVKKMLQTAMDDPEHTI